MNHTSVTARGSLILLAVAIAVLAMVLTRGDSSATSFNPTSSATLVNPAAGEPSTIEGTFNIPAPDANFANLGVVTFTPPQWGLGACPTDNPGAANRTCADLSIPDGAYAGSLDSQSTLGLLNNPCNVLTPVPFSMMDASTDTSSTTTFTDGADGDEVGEQFEDDDSDGIPNGVEAYPDYLTRLVTGASPIQRLYGQVVVSNTNVGLNFLIFAPGVTINGQLMDASLGFPSISILQNTGDTLADPTPPTITDFCTSLQVNLTTFGETQNNPNTGANEAGTANRTNPGSAGSYTFVTYAKSQADADDDGIENALDTCPYDGNPDGWLARGPSTAGDSDNDGIANVCDDSVPNIGDADQDNDGHQNRGDNCPMVANARDQAGVLHGPNNQLDPDSDGIGSACDDNPSSVDGHQHEDCDVSTVQVTGGTAAAPQGAGPAPDVPPCGETPSTPTPVNTSTVTPAPGTITATPAPGTITPTPQPGTITPTPGPGTVTPTPGPATPTPEPGTITPTPQAGTVTPGPVTPTPEPGTVTPTPAPTTAPGEKIWGDGDCNGSITSRDNQALLRNLLSQAALGQTEPCPDFGEDVGNGNIWGDWDCNESISSRDSQALLRNVLSQAALGQTEPCPDIGTPTAIS